MEKGGDTLLLLQGKDLDSSSTVTLVRTIQEREHDTIGMPSTIGWHHSERVSHERRQMEPEALGIKKYHTL